MCNFGNGRLNLVEVATLNNCSTYILQICMKIGFMKRSAMFSLNPLLLMSPMFATHYLSNYYCNIVTNLDIICM